ncbi:MAG TPA: FAD-dependent oxidoreductase [Flavisolibacter sp.]|nr:FAD-dependent oxidoreductase [Flavisolibacter sp.]
MELKSYTGIIFILTKERILIMRRDGACNSIWQSSTGDYIPGTKNTKEDTVDVLIVGGGITGITTGLQLQKRGMKCVIAEAHSICFGTTGGTTAHINTFFDESYQKIKKNFGEDDAQLVARAAKQALDLVRQNIKDYKIDCGFADKDGYLYAQTQEQEEELEKILNASQNAGVAVSYTDHIPVPIEFRKAVVYTQQAQFHPARYVYALAKAFEDAGGIILQNCSVSNFKEAEMLEVETAQGKIKANYLVYATHIPPGINLLHFRCAPYRSYAIAVTLNGNNYPDDLAYDMYDPYHYYRTQEIDGKKYLIAGGEDHKTAHEENTEACFTKLEAHIRKYFDVKEIVNKWSSQYFQPTDGLAYIGHLPGNPENVMVATGYGGNGMTYSHIAANLLSDLIIKGSSDYTELFDPNRIKMVAGFNKFVKENTDVVRQFIGKRLAEEKMTALADLASGEAKVVKYEGESIALYKDENGSLHAINPACTHAKCIVAWNSAEKSWDCPCHGARYNADGEVLTGPANIPLEKINLRQMVEQNKA